MGKELADLEGEGGCRHTVGLDGQGGFTGFMRALEEDLCQAVEGRNLECPGIRVMGPFGVLPGRVAVSDAKDADRTADRQGEPFASVGNEPSLAVERGKLALRGVPFFQFFRLAILPRHTLYVHISDGAPVVNKLFALFFQANPSCGDIICRRTNGRRQNDPA